MKELAGNVITSMDVAEMVDKKHKELLRDIRKYCEQLAESKIALSDFFTESTYITEQNRVMPCFLVTKKGCEFIAHKMTGQKGTEFTARYINRFHEMEKEQKTFTYQYPVSPAAMESATNAGRLFERIMRSEGVPPHEIAMAVRLLFQQAGIDVPEYVVKIPAYEQYTLDIVTR